MLNVAEIVAHYRSEEESKLGKRPRFIPDTVAKGPALATAARRAKARAAYAEIAAILRELRNEGMTLEAIARVLNAEGHATRQGMAWSAASVFRVIKVHG
jgi:hypothetical protein